MNMSEDVEVRQEASISVLSAHPATDNRRAHARYRVELDVTFSSDHNFYMGLAENLSEGGLFVATHTLKSVGSLMEIEVKLPGREGSLRVVGEVRWVRTYNETSDVPPGMGIRFRDLDAESQTVISSFLEQRDPLFFDED